MATPLAAFGIAFAGVENYSGPANGLPYLWAVASAALFALLLANRRTVRAVWPFCFASGMVSSFLWLFDGHNFAVVALLGAVAWMARKGAAPRVRAWRGLRCIAFYVAGFVICFGLGQIVKAVVFDLTYADGSGIVGGEAVIVGGEAVIVGGEVVEDGVFSSVGARLEQIVSPNRIDRQDLTNRAFVAVTRSMTRSQGVFVIALSVVVLGGAVLGASFVAHRRADYRSAWTCLWFTGLILAAGVLFILPNDLPERSARYLSLSLALCWSCFAAVASHLWGQRGALAAAAGALAIAVWPAALIALKQLLWRHDVDVALAGAAPVVASDFDIYLADEGESVIYVKEPCGHGGRASRAEAFEGGWHPRFFLHLRPRDWYFQENIDFKLFEADFAMYDGSRCVAMQSLSAPAHDFKSIVTGQYGPRGRLWVAAMEFPDTDPVILLALCGVLADGKVYGNSAIPYAVHIGGGAAGACALTPERGVWREIAGASGPEDPLSLWLERYAEEGDHLVWVHDSHASLLPGYDAADLRGRSALREVAWLESSAVFRVEAELSGETDSARAARPASASGSPAVSSFFDVHVDDRTIIYFREPCARPDTAARFFLHVYPADVGDLPEHRSGNGFENLDFGFERVGSRFGGACMASVQLPDYDIGRILTGQFDDGAGVWAVEMPFGSASAPAAPVSEQAGD